MTGAPPEGSTSPLTEPALQAEVCLAQRQGWAVSCPAGTLQGRPSCVPEHRPAGMTR